MFPVDLMVQAVPTDPMGQCHLGVQRDRDSLPVQKNLLVLVNPVVLMARMVLEIQETLFHPQVLATQVVLKILGFQTDQVAQVGNREVLRVPENQADLRDPRNQADP